MDRLIELNVGSYKWTIGRSLLPPIVQAQTAAEI
jgi:hypothetical protein